MQPNAEVSDRVASNRPEDSIQMNPKFYPRTNDNAIQIKDRSPDD